MSRRAVKHRVHGRLMTDQDIADELGLGAGALRSIRWRYKHMTTEEIYDAYASGRIRRRICGKHIVHGREMTLQEAADAYGITLNWLHILRAQRRGSGGYEPLEATLDWYANQPKPRRGVKPTLYRVFGRRVTLAQAADELGLTYGAFVCWKYRNGASKAQLEKRLEDLYTRRAVNRIVEILAKGNSQGAGSRERGAGK